MVLAASRAREITHDDAPVLFNVVEEMSIAAGLPMPKVYIVDDSAPNAFATGRDPEHASVAVTSGLLEKLDRDELQGVMAHEMSHVANFDIRYSMLVGILVGTTVLISDFFLRGLWFGGGRGGGRSGGDGGGQLQLIMMLIAIVLAILAPLFARLLQLSISRQREFLADATRRQAHPQPQGTRRRSAEDQWRQRGPRGGQPRDGPPLHRQPHKEVREAFQGSLLHPPADRGEDHRSYAPWSRAASPRPADKPRRRPHKALQYPPLHCRMV